MAKTPLHWRTIEFHTAEILREGGLELDQPADSGDIKIVTRDYSRLDLNVTEFAKLLAERLQ